MVFLEHPKHERFYRRLFGFASLGDLKAYPAVRDNPAVACYHDFAGLDREGYRLYDQIYGVPYAEEDLQGRAMSDAERYFFQPAADGCESCLPIAGL